MRKTNKKHCFCFTCVFSLVESTSRLDCSSMLGHRERREIFYLKLQTYIEIGEVKNCLSISLACLLVNKMLFGMHWCLKWFSWGYLNTVPKCTQYFIVEFFKNISIYKIVWKLLENRICTKIVLQKLLFVH